MSDNVDQTHCEQTGKSMKNWINTLTDKYFVQSIKNNYNLRFNFVDNTYLEGKIKWFNKFNLCIVDNNEREYILLKHALKYIIKSKI